MAPDITISTESDPVPIVCILAAQLRRATTFPQVATRLAKMQGSAALRCTVDPQAATMTFDRGHIRVVRGVAARTGVLIRTDVNRMSIEGEPQPAISGALRHLPFALALSKVLSLPDRPWTEDAATFWRFATHHDGVPTSLRVVNLDDASELTFGVHANQPDYEIHGTDHALRNLFSGNTIFGQELFEGRIFAIGSLAHTAELSGRSLAWTLGATG